MATKKTKTKTVTSPKSRTVYMAWPSEKIDDDMLSELLTSYHDKIDGAKIEVECDGEVTSYIYQVTVTRVAKGSQPPFTWTKE